MTEIEKFERELRLRRYSQNTIDTYVSCLKILYHKVSITFDIDKIKDFILTIDKPNYHKQFVATTRNYYKFVKGITIDLNDLPYPRKEERIPDILSFEEMRRLIEYPKNLKHQIVICYLYNCGLRVGELINLKLSDIDRNRMAIHIKQGKGKKDRDLPLHSDLLTLTEKYYHQYKPVEYLLNGQYSLQYTESSVNQLLKYWALKSGIKRHIHAHKIRHCYGTHLHEIGTDLNIIQRLMGHKSVKTTNIYTKTSTAHRNAVSLLNGIKL